MDLSEEFILELTQCQSRLYGFLFKRLANRDQTQEVLQRANLVLCKKAGEYQSGSNFFAWAAAVAHFQLLAYRKEQVRERLVFSDDVLELLDQQTAGELRAAPAVHRHLQFCLEHLSKENRDLLARRYDESLTTLQIASALGKSANSIRLKLHRLRLELSRCIQRRLSEEPA